MGKFNKCRLVALHESLLKVMGKVKPSCMRLVEVMSQGQINMHNFLGLLVHSVFLLILSVYMMAEIQFYYCLTQSFLLFISDLDHAVSEDVAGNFCLLQYFCISSRIVQSGAEFP